MVIFLCLIVALLDPCSSLGNINNTCVGDEGLPSFKSYQLDISENNDQKDMKGWFNMVNKFIRAVQPSDELLDSFIDYATTKEFHIPESVYEILSLEKGIVACIVIGLIYVIVMWLIGIFFFCCRLCNNCGGKRTQNISERTGLWRQFLTILLGLVAVLMLIAIICMFATNNHLKGSLSETEDNIIAGFNDVDHFMNTTYEQIRYLTVSCLDATFRDILNNMDDIKTQIGDPVVRDLMGNISIEELVEKSDDIDSGIQNITEKLEEVVNEIDGIRSDYSKLENEVQRIKNDLQNIKNVCNENCDSIDLDSLAINPNSSLQKFDLNGKLNEFEELRDFKVTNKTILLKEAILDFPKSIKNKTFPITEDVKNQIMSFNAEIRDGKYKKELDSILSEVLKQTNIGRKTVKETMDLIRPYEGYRWWGGFTVCVIVAVLEGALIVGLCLGIFGYKKDRHPTHRTMTSHSGGFLLIVAVYLMFLFSGFLMLLVIPLFLVGSHGQIYVCLPLYQEDLAFLDKIMDVIRNETSGTNKLIQNLEPSKVLLHCKDDKTAFKALNLDEVLDISDVVNYEKHIGLEKIEEKLKEIIQELEISFDFSDISGSTLNVVDLPMLKEALSQNVLTIDNATLNEWRAIETQDNKLNEVIEEIERLNRRDELLELVEILEKQSVYLQETINEMNELMKKQKVNLNNNLINSAEKETRRFIHKLLDKGNQYVNSTLTAVNFAVGKCGIVWNIFDSVRIVLCKHYLEPVNGFWFGLGWCLTFFIPAIIIATKLSKHFLRMSKIAKYEGGVEAGNEPYAVELVEDEKTGKKWFHQNRVYPTYDPTQW
ncbi:prominin-1-like isoform X2 [Tachypleus tridentatus]|uniref:prominin-1-like isoform X2 n=1 Tax=Tachypleus tridentatus TaxID=6853 RepID=UPI003FD35112